VQQGIKRARYEKITAVLNETLAKVPESIRFGLVAAMWRADKNVRWSFFQALLRGDIPGLNRLLKASDD
jgi:hypothetical protein